MIDNIQIIEFLEKNIKSSEIALYNAEKLLKRRNNPIRDVELKNIRRKIEIWERLIDLVKEREEE